MKLKRIYVGETPTDNYEVYEVVEATTVEGSKVSILTKVKEISLSELQNNRANHQAEIDKINEMLGEIAEISGN